MAHVISSAGKEERYIHEEKGSQKRERGKIHTYMKRSERKGKEERYMKKRREREDRLRNKPLTQAR